ncbi:MAG: TonB-dependent receptor, partial [Vicinamibacterales bacterium]
MIRRVPSSMRHWCAVAVLCLAAAHPALAQSTGVIDGRVVTPDGLALPGAVVTARSRSGPAAPETVTDAGGHFRLEGLAPATWVVTATTGDGLGEGRASVTVGGGAVATVTVNVQLGFSERVTVTDTRSARLKSETAATVGSVTHDTLAAIRPTHPSEVMGLVPGVWVNITGGEGHQTAIRQPLTTNPVYLYLEDGVPTRSTGFFNHNALYEINVPAAEGIEVTKGPGSALYGSDAIGGVINVLTRSSLGTPGTEVSVEGGQDGWRRAMAGGNWTSGQDGVRGTVNLTHSDGWRDATGYDRQGGTLRYDRARPGSLAKVLFSVNNIDQQTAGSSSLSEVDYLADPSVNLTPISLRKVQAYRLSLDYRRMHGDSQVSLVPYFRYDTMDLLANWSLTYDPTTYTTSNTSWGLLAKVERALPRWRASVIAGVDVDLSPGSHVEDIVRAT